MRPFVVVALVSAALWSSSACGGDSSSSAPELSAAAAEGRRIANSNGCAACHGSDGRGGVGPAFQGLAGSDRELVDGSIVVADRDYLYESITQPGARLVAGYRVLMPSNELDDAEVAAIITYIEELAAP
jgi:cytochrome c oxidase subunit 2